MYESVSDDEWSVAAGRGHTVLSFRLTGIVDGEVVAATFAEGVLICDAPLRDRAELIVAMGDTFEAEDRRQVGASLDEPLPALLTLIRACAVTFAHIRFIGETSCLISHGVGSW